MADKNKDLTIWQKVMNFTGSTSGSQSSQSPSRSSSSSSSSFSKYPNIRVVNNNKPDQLEKQKLMLGYSLGISFFSPMANLYQVQKLYFNKSGLKAFDRVGMRLCSRIYFQQVLLRMLQLNFSTPIKENLSAWPAFASIGILQGAVYGHANIYFAKQYNIDSLLSYKNMFRGSGYAAIRDMISQGIPFMFCDNLRQAAIDPVLSPYCNHQVCHWTALVTTSIFATYLSQGLHNCQVAMQTHHDLGYVNAVKHMHKQHGIKFMYKGVESRVVLLLITNVFNEIFLKPAWGRD